MARYRQARGHLGRTAVAHQGQLKRHQIHIDPVILIHILLGPKAR